MLSLMSFCEIISTSRMVIPSVITLKIRYQVVITVFKKVLVANRGAVAGRVIRALNEMGVASVAVYSEADAGAPYVKLATESYYLGAGPVQESYLNQDKLLEVIARSAADAVHPGYGFLSENAGFARIIADCGVCFIGPSPEWIDLMGDKVQARQFMKEAGMPLANGSGLLHGSDEEMVEAAQKVGFPVLVKPSGGGGGIGMVPAHDEEELVAAIERSRNLASRNFSNPKIFIEKLIEKPRHIEFQMLGDKNGAVRHLFERDCSVQRRHQKVLEESPAPAVARDVLDAVAEKAAEVISTMGYDNIGTVEMLLGADGNFSFLEMNTRLQVEHAVTEMVTGIDLVKSQILSASGSSLEEFLPDKIEHKGHAIEARVYAENPKNFIPSPGPLTVYRPPKPAADLRVETGFCEGMSVSTFYDPMLAKVIAWAPTREAAVGKLSAALESFEIEGVKNNIPFVLQVLNNEDFLSGNIDTTMTDKLKVKNRKYLK